MNYQALQVWRRSKDLAVVVYKLIQNSAISKDYSFRDQIQRCSVSIPSNIAEGYSRDTNKDRIHFLHIARGSASELTTQLMIAQEVGLMPKNEVHAILSEIEEIQKMLMGLIKSLKRAQ